MSILRNTFLLKRLVVVFAFAAVFAGWSAIRCSAQDEKKEAVTYSAKDREAVLKFFAESQEKFNKAILGLSDAQMNFRPDEKSWSVALVAEHIVISDGAIFGMIEQGVLKSPLNTNADAFRVRDIAIKLAVTNRGQKFNAPDAVQPKAAMSKPDDLITAFAKARGSNTVFLKNTTIDLRNHFADNGLIGVIDAYQWFLFMNSHTERHLAQIEEIKAHPDFPKN